MSDFTKGKWYYSTHETKSSKHKRIKISSGVSYSDGVIKQIATLTGTNTESYANARLIAAAPEMYSELILAMASLRDGDICAQRLADRIEELLDRIDGKEEYE